MSGFRTSIRAISRHRFSQCFGVHFPGAETSRWSRDCQRDHLAQFRQQLAEQGVAAPDFKTAWIVLLAHCPNELQPEDMRIRHTGRAAAAGLIFPSSHAMRSPAW